MHRPRSTSQKHYFSASGTHVYSKLSKPQGLLRPEELGSLMKFIPVYRKLFMYLCYFDMFYIQWHHLAKKDVWNKVQGDYKRNDGL
jgi:hypothetical protein